MKLMRVLSYFETGGKSHYDYPVSLQSSFLESLGEPRDNIERSYNQYLCQRFFVPWYLKVASDLIAYISTPLLLLLFLLKGIRSKSGVVVDCIGDAKGMEEIYPETLKERYNIKTEFWNTGNKIDWEDLFFVLTLIKRHPFSPLFILKNMVKIAKYSSMICCHSPKAIVVHNEFSFTSSLLTEYCHRRNVLHINVMHGEKLYNIRDSFFSYDTCYVWDIYYANLMTDLKANPYQFAIALPPSMKIDCKIYKDDAAYADYKYYLTTTTEEKIVAIAKSMEFATNKGKTVKYRLHPRYSDSEVVEKIVGRENIEFPRETSIMSSISNCGCVVGCFTTVLNQAYNSGVPILLDDVAEKEMFDKLKPLRYILIDKGLPLLSEMQVR